MDSPFFISPPMHITFCANDRYVPHLSALIESIVAHNSGVTFHLVCNDLSDTSRHVLSTQCAAHGAGMSFHTYDDSVTAAFPSTISYISKETYLRFFLASILPDLDRVLYLDGDIIVKGSLTPLWETDLGDAYLGGVSDEYTARAEVAHLAELGVLAENYINAGVLLINLKAWRAVKLADQLVEMTVQHAHHLKFLDQDALNLTAKGRICYLPKRFNFTTENVRFATKSEVDDAAVIHYTGPEKPWSAPFSAQHPLATLYWQALAKSPYRERYEKAKEEHCLSYLFHMTKTRTTRYFTVAGGRWVGTVTRWGQRR